MRREAISLYSQLATANNTYVALQNSNSSKPGVENDYIDGAVEKNFDDEEPGMVNYM